MVPLTSLLLPILLAGVLVFAASSLIHMVLRYHSRDFAPVPNEEVVRAALRVPPGDYVTPYAASMEAMKAPEFQRKMQEGPVAFFTVMQAGQRNMGVQLAQWFVYCLVVSLFAAYIAGRAVGPGEPYMSVFRFTSVTAFIGYTLALWQGRIWYGRSWRYMFTLTLDGFIYGLLTGGAFGWLWPGA